MKNFSNVDTCTISFKASEDPISFKMIKHYFWLSFKKVNSFRSSKKKHYERHQELVEKRIVNRYFKNVENEWFFKYVEKVQTEKVFASYQNRTVIDYDVIYTLDLNKLKEDIK